MRRSVLLPHPLGPTSATTSFWRTANEMPEIASTAVPLRLRYTFRLLFRASAGGTAATIASAMLAQHAHRGPREGGVEQARDIDRRAQEPLLYVEALRAVEECSAHFLVGREAHRISAADDLRREPGMLGQR